MLFKSIQNTVANTRKTKVFGILDKYFDHSILISSFGILPKSDTTVGRQISMLKDKSI